MVAEIKKAWNWVKSIWLMASNITKVLDGQKETKERLDKIEEVIKSPQYRVAELEQIKLTVDLLKENHEQEIKKLRTGSQEEIATHKTRIEELEKIIIELSEYKKLILQTIEIIKAKDLKIKELNEELEKVKKKAPSNLSELLAAGSMGLLPDALYDVPLHPFFSSILGLGQPDVQEKDK